MDTQVDLADAQHVSENDSPLQLVAKICSAGGCPTIYQTSTGDLLVQGYTVIGESPVDLPEGEALVKVPLELLTAALQSLRQAS